MYKGLGPAAYVKQLEAENKEVIAGELYSRIDASGHEVFIVRVVNENTIQKVIDAKRNQEQIDWSNATKKDRPLIENQCLANWMKASFDTEVRF